MSTFFKIALVLFFSGLYTYGQNNTIEHLIKKGENVYRISLKYNVTIDAIYQLNPESKEVIRTGEILLIPKFSNSSSLDISDEYSNYIVSKGETKYGISKSFGISITALEELNPFIRNGLQAGHNLRVPSNGITNTISETNGTHVVAKGETLWRISQNYNMPIEELRQLNKGRLNGNLIEIGQILIVSDNKNTITPKTYLVKKGDTKFKLSKQFDLSITELETLNPQIKDVLRTGTLITLKKSEENTNKNNDTTITISEKPPNTITESEELYVIKPKETLYSIAKKAGITTAQLIALNPKLETSVMAGDTIRLSSTSGQNITNKTVKTTPFKTDIFWIEHSTENTTDITNKADDYLKGINDAIASAKTNHPNMIPNLIRLKQADSLQFEETNDNSIRYKIKPIPNFNYNNDISKLGTFIITKVDSNTSKTIIVKTLPTYEEMQEKMINYLKNENGKVICLYDRNHSVNIKSFKEQISEVELIKLSRNGSFKTKDLKENLDSTQKNYVIIESSRVGVFLSVTSLLLKESSKYDIQLVVLNAQNIPDNTKVSYNRFKILNLMYPKPYNPNYLKETSESYKMGYLLSSDILNRLKLDGVNTFKNKKSTSFLGTIFSYKFNNDMAQNKAVSIYMFNDNSDAYLIGTY
ncbi:LysM peptidoglycan-binding domain-containing protein [Ichthyenterobacterium sp. W332]|uniref:LysM peptidoglycan-binding domain-containing protein n=1 Tax=Microcosmobacter mediterraneus TaxID=3075607 RepID=A0ABU2YN36_9FLAO|nr:LysM peptidoglycan-binding domain-containing protein [Ichthyenterobacterium sp. W332]MDT0559301.1 LysM peptidoglycan-binding domain-containing protein [Ichthyenterobacterium sp. W332]